MRARLRALYVPALLAAACACSAGAGPEPRAMEEAAPAPPAPARAPATETATAPYPPPAPGPAARVPAEGPAGTPPVPPLPAEERELLQAYARYWELYAEALYSLDGGRLGEVMTGARLQRAREEVGRLLVSGHAVRLLVEHDAVVGMLEGEKAVIVDRYLNRSYLVDARTGAALGEPGPGNAVTATVSLVREEGRWKVRESRREVQP